MGIQYGWYIPEQVIYINFYNRVTAEEFAEMNEDLAWMIAGSRAEVVHIIQDESNIKGAPPEFGRLLRNSVIAQGKINGCVITIGKKSEHRVMKFISTVLARVSNTRHERFYHREEAEAYLEAIDPGIDLYRAERHFLEMTVIPDVSSHNAFV